MKCKLFCSGPALSFVRLKQTAASSAPLTRARQFLIYMQSSLAASINMPTAFSLVTADKPRGWTVSVYVVIGVKPLGNGVEEPSNVLRGFC